MEGFEATTKFPFAALYNSKKTMKNRETNSFYGEEATFL